uniref:Uncharacterized protein n=1 Tax=Anguilla anguilla TaxID=7936 RepID=A0A0E9T679_ANGAN
MVITHFNTLILDIYGKQVLIFSEQKPHQYHLPSFSEYISSIWRTPQK